MAAVESNYETGSGLNYAMDATACGKTRQGSHRDRREVRSEPTTRLRSAAHRTRNRFRPFSVACANINRPYEQLASHLGDLSAGLRWGLRPSRCVSFHVGAAGTLYASLKRMPGLCMLRIVGYCHCKQGVFVHQSNRRTRRVRRPPLPHAGLTAVLLTAG
jgi:hypothetical protein